MRPGELLEHYALEAQIMRECAGLPAGGFAFRDVAVGGGEHVHCCEVRTEPELPKPRLLMIHGYGGNNIFFFKMYRFLAPRFHIVSMDLPGMGFNSRGPGAPFATLAECLRFFVDRINGCAEALGWERFSLAGHSMGAYFAAQFFDRHAYKVDRLFLLSPAAFNGARDSAHIAERLRRLSVWGRALARRYERVLHVEKKSPFEGLNATLRDLGVALVMRSRRMGFSRREAALLTRLFRFLLSLPQYGEKCVCFVIDIGLRSPAPVIDVLLRHLDRLRDVSVVYGQHDTMDFETSLRAAAELALPLDFYQLRGCDHQLILQRPAELAALMLDAFDGRREPLRALRLAADKYAAGLRAMPLEP